MRTARRMLWSGLAVVILVGIAAAPVHAQGKAKGKDKHYAVSSDKAVNVTRTVLIDRGYQVVRVERVGLTQVIYFHRGNNGRGKGKGPLQRMVIRTDRGRVFFEEAEPSILVDIDIKLKL
jgi:hypothetical protein